MGKDSGGHDNWADSQMISRNKPSNIRESGWQIDQ